MDTPLLSTAGRSVPSDTFSIQHAKEAIQKKYQEGAKISAQDQRALNELEELDVDGDGVISLVELLDLASKEAQYEDEVEAARRWKSLDTALSKPFGATRRDSSREFLKVSLILLLIVSIGSVVFMFLERDEELSMRKDFQQLMADVERRLNNTNLYRRVVAHAGDPETKYHDFGDYSRVWMFAFTVVTTIGFGVVTVHTPAGQCFCVLYALLGIPAAGVCLTVMANVALERVSMLLSKGSDHVRSAFEQFDQDHSGTLDMHEMRLALVQLNIELDDYQFFDFVQSIDDGDGKITLGEFKAASARLHMDLEEIAARKKRLTAALIILGLWVALGTVVFYLSEGSNMDGCSVDGMVGTDPSCAGWTVYESLYFVFTSLTTIGFGDLFPNTKSAQIFLVAFCMIGLGILSILITLLQNRVHDLTNKQNVKNNEGGKERCAETRPVLAVGQYNPSCHRLAQSAAFTDTSSGTRLLRANTHQ
jgi:Ca2+-binding EF-hand superfamily protein